MARLRIRRGAAMDGVVREVRELGRGRETIPLGDLVAVLGTRGFGPIVLGLCLFLIPPIGFIPGMGGVVGILLLLVASQVFRGRQGLWLPRVLRERQLPANRLIALLARVRPATKWLRRRTRERGRVFATGPVALRVLAATMAATGVAMISMGWIPVIPPLLGIPLALFAIGLTERDGAFVLAGYAMLIPPIVVGVWWAG